MTTETKYFRIFSQLNFNRLAGIWATDEAAALAQFHEEMHPTVLEVCAIEAES